MERRTVTQSPRENRLDPELIAVIAAVLEVELKRRENFLPGRFTFSGGDAGWDRFGKALINPYQRGGKP